MNPGPELDALVAEKVMGWRHEIFEEDNAFHQKRRFLAWTQDGKVIYSSLPRYSTSIAAAWDVVEKMCALFPERPLRIGRRWGDGGMHTSWDVDSGAWWDADAVDTAIRVRGDTAPHAICLAALRAVGAIK